MSKTYANRSNAFRAIRSAGIDSNTIVVKQNDAGQWYWEAKAIEPAPALAPKYRIVRRKPKAAAPAQATPETAPVAAATVAAAPTGELGKQRHKDFQVYGKSKTVSPVKVVHDFLAEHGEKLSRKQALFELAKMGVNYATARTQYQRWFSGK